MKLIHFQWSILNVIAMSQRFVLRVDSRILNQYNMLGQFSLKGLIDEDSN